MLKLDHQNRQVISLQTRIHALWTSSLVAIDGILDEKRGRKEFPVSERNVDKSEKTVVKIGGAAARGSAQAGERRVRKCASAGRVRVSVKSVYELVKVGCGAEVRESEARART